MCARIVESQGLNAEGIYRVSGKKDDVMDLQDKYDNGEPWHQVCF